MVSFKEEMILLEKKVETLMLNSSNQNEKLSDMSQYMKRTQPSMVDSRTD